MSRLLHPFGLSRYASRWRALWRAGALCVLLAFAGTGYAIDREQAFEDPELNQRYHDLIREVRCLVCQNQTISDSNADLAADLRREVREMIGAGRSDAEIVEFLTSRYGDFVMYRPPVQPTTWALWGGPAVLLAIGAVVFMRILRARAGQPVDEDDLS